MNGNKKISVIIPCYNIENYISECLDSVINQTYPNLEIICVNDGSNDSTLSILNEYKQKDDRIIVVDQKNQGLSAARNAGLDVLSGEFVMFIDGDDWIDERTCETAINEAVNSNCDVVLWNYTREFEDVSKEQFIFGKEKTDFRNEDYKKSIYMRIFGLTGDELMFPQKSDSIVTAWGKLYKTSLIINNDKTVSFIDTKLIGTEDAIFNIFALGNGNSATYLPDCFYHYRKTNTNSVTSIYKPNLYYQWQAMYDMIEKYIYDKKLDETYFFAFQNRICLSIIGLGLNVLYADNSVKKIKEIKRIISSPRYRKAYNQLELKYFPFHWKVFFAFAKYNCSVGVYLMLKAIRFMIGR